MTRAEPEDLRQRAGSVEIFFIAGTVGPKQTILSADSPLLFDSQLYHS